MKPTTGGLFIGASIKKRWNKFIFLFSRRFLLNMYYGERLRDYPLKVAIKMLLSRFAFASLIPILLPDKHILMNYYGARMYFNIAQGPVEIDLAFGAYEYWKAKLIFDLVKPGMTIIDIGASRGNYSILFANLMKDSGKVVAFEPDPENCGWLRKNIQINKYKCIELHQCALSDKDGITTFYPGIKYGLGSLIYQSSMTVSGEESITVQTQTLDSVLKKEHIRDVHLIKMDVEGNDLQVLKGAEHTLRSNNCSLLMDVDVFSNEERKELFELLKSYGFAIYRIGRELIPITMANQLFLFDEDKKSTSIKTHQIVRDIYATKLK